MTVYMRRLQTGWLRLAVSKGGIDMKDYYAIPQIEIIILEDADVIRTSLGEDETDMVPMSETWL